MKTKFLVLSAARLTSATTLALALFLAPGAHAAESLTHLDDDTEAMTMDAQVAEVEGYGFDDYATQTKIETKTDEQEVKNLDRKLKRLEQNKKATEASAKRATERLQASQLRKADMSKRAAKLEAEQRVEESKLKQIVAKVDKLNDQTLQARERAQKAKEAYLQAAQHHQDVLRRQKQLQAEMKAHQREQQNYHAKQKKLASRN